MMPHRSLCRNQRRRTSKALSWDAISQQGESLGSERQGSWSVVLCIANALFLLAKVIEPLTLDSRESLQGSRTEPHRFQIEAIRTNRTDVVKIWVFCESTRIHSVESILANRPDSCCKSLGHLILRLEVFGW